MWKENKKYIRIKIILGTMTSLFCFGMAIYSVALAGRATTQFEVIWRMICVMPWACAGAVLLVHLHLHSVSDGILDWLMAPRQFRDRPAPLVTPVRALVRQERYDEARERLTHLLEEYPEVPELRILHFDLLNGPLDRPDDAMRTAESYFIRPERVRSEDNAKLLLRYVGLARELGRENDAARLLAAELHRRKTGYTRAERKTLGTTLATLRTGNSGSPN